MNVCNVYLLPHIFDVFETIGAVARVDIKDRRKLTKAKRIRGSPAVKSFVSKLSFPSSSS